MRQIKFQMFSKVSSFVAFQLDKLERNSSIWDYVIMLGLINKNATCMYNSYSDASIFSCYIDSSRSSIMFVIGRLSSTLSFFALQNNFQKRNSKHTCQNHTENEALSRLDSIEVIFPFKRYFKYILFTRFSSILRTLICLW